MGNKNPKWIWQHPEYPHFRFERNALTPLIADIEYLRGTLEGMSRLFSHDDKKTAQIDALTDELIHSSLIEGELYKRESVRSSFRKKLDENFDADQDKYATAQTDSLVEILIDANLNASPLTVERLHGWHNCLFEHSPYSGLRRIHIARFRDHDDMEVVSGAIGFEKVHYQAVPVSRFEADIRAFLNFCNSGDESIYIRGAIAHLWFVIIHPYDDGNGRIARAITDYILSSHAQENTFKLYSISAAINHDRKGYYAVLDQTTHLFRNRDFDITPWLIWHLTIFQDAMNRAIDTIDYLVQKTRFWDRHRDKALNPRQIKVLNKILDMGVENFKGGLSTRKYISMTKVSKATAVRDINQLLDFGCIRQVAGSEGRNVRYVVTV